MAAAAVRYAFRLWQEQRRRPSASTSRRVVVLGAGEAGAQIVRTMLRNPASPYLPVALLDDDPGKRALRLHGVRVEGCRDDLVAVAERRNADAVLLAIPSASGETLRSLAEPAFAAGIDVLVLPPVEELLGTVTIGDIRPMSEADLIERRPVEVDLASITEHLTGRRILVTGAGGSIGSELCRQLDGIRPAALVMLDRDESGLHATQLAIEGRALLDSPRLVVADIRDRGWLLEVFTRHQPEVVFHTAALKHEPLLELHPGEAWKTNVLGTQNVLDAAVASGVQLFVNLSTDKAADPTSVLGASKRITERLTADAAQRTGRPYVSVRFGNVLGSRGSVITTFRAQITAGGPITITHPDATRFFMTVQEAVVLMIQAAALGEPGETMVLDMGTSVRIEHIARRLILQGGRPVEIVYTGLRPGEKLHETLLNSREPDLRPRHPLISHVCVPPLSLDEAEQVCLEEGSLHPRGTTDRSRTARRMGRKRGRERPDYQRASSTRRLTSSSSSAAVARYRPMLRLYGSATSSAGLSRKISDAVRSRASRRTQSQTSSCRPRGPAVSARATRSRNWNVRCQVDPSIRTTARRCSWVIVITRSLPSCARSSGVMERDASCVMVTPSSDMTRWARLSPAIGDASVPAEAAATVGPRPVSRARRSAAAIGDRHTLAVHTKSTRISSA